MALTNFLKDIADAIREKEGSSEPIKALDFAERIRNLVISGGEPITMQFVVNWMNDNNGDSGCDIMLIGTDENVGNYDICWANDSGIMDDYYTINSILIQLDEEYKFHYCHLIENNLIPIGATKLVAVKNGAIEAEYSIPQNKRTIIGDKKFSFGVISDSHIGASSKRKTKLIPALDYLNTKCDFIAHCGDMVDSARQEYVDDFRDIITENLDIPLYSVLGNHEMKDRDSGYLDEHRDYLRSPFTDGIEDCYCIEHNGDAFVFLSVYDNIAGSIGFSAKEQLQIYFERYKNKRLFLFYHYPYIVGTAGGNVGVAGALEDVEFIKHNNTILFTGHSHVRFELQEQNDNHNMYVENGKRIVHTPAIYGVNDDRTDADNLSQCFIVDVYDNHVIMNAIDIVGEKKIPLGSFIINTNEIEQKRIKLDGENVKFTSRKRNFDKGSNIAVPYEIIDDNTFIYLLQSSASEVDKKVKVDADNIYVDDIQDTTSMYMYCGNIEENQMTFALTNGNIENDGNIAYTAKYYLTDYIEFDDRYQYHVYCPYKEYIGINNSITVKVAHYSDIGVLEKISYSYTKSNGSSAIDFDINKYSNNSKYFRINFICNALNDLYTALPYLIVTKKPI